MELEKQVDGQVAVLRCSGRLNMGAAGRLRAAVDETVADGVRRIVVDLSETSFVDSSGLGALVGGLKSARQAGGDLRIAAAPEQVRTVLALTNLDRVLTPHQTVEDAHRGW
ncbi:STAS domain-containing protein [Nocardioides bigeumensis]|uniref:Anti-sigma factor antagonist n=1 Tax=Nocardioides bigeumensis TaxID=433657 RepID=A0ABN2XX24_9ACTN